LGRRDGTTVEERFWEKVIVGEEEICWEWIAGQRGGYGYGGFYYGGKTLNAHRASWLINCGDIPEGLQVLHTCDNATCVNPSHLYLGTNYDNIQDRVKRGRSADRHGENHPFSRLKLKDIMEIRALAKDGDITTTAIAKKFGISIGHASDIINGKKWRKAKGVVE